MDRLAGIFMDANPESHFTSRFPLQPFMNHGIKVGYDDPRRWLYTTIGNMARDTRALGYMYSVPASPDYSVHKTAEEKGHIRPKPSGGQAIALPLGLAGSDADSLRAKATQKPTNQELVPYVIFTDVGCTTSSYRINVFITNPTSTKPEVENPDFIGQVTRIGMGRGSEEQGPPNTGRCRKPAATRVLSAEEFKDRLGKVSELLIVVTDLETGKEVDETEYTKMSGFVPKLAWLPGHKRE